MQQININLPETILVRGTERQLKPIKQIKPMVVDYESWSPRDGFTFATIFEPHTGTETKAVYSVSRKHESFTNYCGVMAIIDGSDDVSLTDEKCVLDFPLRRAFPKYQAQIQNVEEGVSEIKIIIYADKPSFYWCRVVEPRTYAELLDYYRKNEFDKITEKFPDLKDNIDRIERNQASRKLRKSKVMQAK